MSKDIVQTKFPVSKKDSMEIMRNLPFFRISYLFVIISIPIVYLISYLTISRPANLKIAETASQLNKLNKESFIYMTIAGIIFLLFALLIMKLLEKVIGMRFYKNFKKSGASHLLVGIDMKNSNFILGEDKKRYPITDEFKLVSTPNNYIFYKGKSPKPLMFFLPKRGNDLHEEVLKEILITVQKENISIKERKK